MRSGAAIAGVVVASLLATGCLGSDATSVGGGEATMVTLEPVPAEPPADVAPDELRAELVQPTPGMADVRPVPWDEAQVDGQTVTVSWWSGVAPCNVLDRVEVEEAEEVVTITLFEGSDPAEPDAACIEIGQRKSTVVELTEPVGKRSLVDGAGDAAR